MLDAFVFTSCRFLFVFVFFVLFIYSCCMFNSKTNHPTKGYFGVCVCVCARARVFVRVRACVCVCVVCFNLQCLFWFLLLLCRMISGIFTLLAYNHRLPTRCKQTNCSIYAAVTYIRFR